MIYTSCYDYIHITTITYYQNPIIYFFQVDTLIKVLYMYKKLQVFLKENLRV